MAALASAFADSAVWWTRFTELTKIADEFQLEEIPRAWIDTEKHPMFHYRRLLIKAQQQKKKATAADHANKKETAKKRRDRQRRRDSDSDNDTGDDTDTGDRKDKNEVKRPRLSSSMSIDISSHNRTTEQHGSELPRRGSACTTVLPATSATVRPSHRPHHDILPLVVGVGVALGNFAPSGAVRDQVAAPPKSSLPLPSVKHRRNKEMKCVIVIDD